MRRPIGLLVTMTACVSACGGGSGVSGAGTASYAVGGTVAGLAGAGLVLQVNGGGNLPISADGAFKFAAAFAGGSGYAVTVVTQPSSPAQYCAVAGGSGTVGTTDVSTVKVTCVASRFTVLAHQPPASGGLTMLLTDGSVMMQSNNDAGVFYRSMGVANGIASTSFALTIN